MTLHLLLFTFAPSTVRNLRHSVVRYRLYLRSLEPSTGSETLYNRFSYHPAFYTLQDNTILYIPCSNLWGDDDISYRLLTDKIYTALCTFIIFFCRVVQYSVYMVSMYRYGQCYQYVSGGAVFSTCQCLAGTYYSEAWVRIPPLPPSRKRRI